MVDLLEPFDHPGLQSKAIRETRNLLRKGHALEPKHMAQLCNVSVRHIQRFEQGTNLLSDEVFSCYVNALGLPVLDTQHLKVMYRSYRQRESCAYRLSFYDFQLVTYSPVLRKVAANLRTYSHPVFLMDELQYVHVQSSSLYNLFGLTDKWLLNPYLWHWIGMKLYPSSPVRIAHETPHNEYYSYCFHAFHEALAPWFFAAPSLSIQRALLTLSRQEYGRAWLAAVTLLEPAWLDAPQFILRRRETQSVWRLRKLESLSVPVPNGPVLLYHLMALDPVDQVAHAVNTEICQDVEPIFACKFGLRECTL